jgi:1-acyl-sn-glycerol-3-phosphate acyltransferase
LHLSQLHKSDGVLYNILVHFCLLGQYGTLRRIEMVGKEKVPLDRPLMIAANHPTAFMDPILFTTMFDQPMYNMTRGDIFEKPLAGKALISMNMFPVYRARDGYGTSRRNQKVFSYTVKKLVEEKTIVIFVEGQHHLDTQLKPLQKGIAHIAQYGMETEPSLQNLTILPIGVNYRWGNRIWDDVSITIGEPYEAAPWFGVESALPQEERGGAFLKDLEAKLLHLVHHLEDLDDQPVFDLAKEMVRSEVIFPVLPQVKAGRNDSFLKEKAVVAQLNQLDATAKTHLRSAATKYTAALNQAGITDREVVIKSNPMQQIALLVLGFLPFLMGMIGALPIKLVTNWLVRTKVQKEEFITSAIFGGGILMAMFWYIPIMIWSFLTWKPYFIAAALSLPLLGWFTNPYIEMWKDTKLAFRYRGLKNQEALKQLRAEIRGYLWSA